MTETNRARDARLFQEYRRTGSADIRQQIATDYRPLSIRIAEIFARGRQLNPDQWDEAVQDAAIGMLQAIDAFDPGRGYRFSTYATIRIRGHLLDCERKRNGRSVRRVHVQSVPEDVLIRLAGTSNDPGLQQIDNADQLRILRGLPDRTRDILYGRFVAGETRRDVARRHNISERTVTGIIDAVRKQLRDRKPAS